MRHISCLSAEALEAIEGVNTKVLSHGHVTNVTTPFACQYGQKSRKTSFVTVSAQVEISKRYITKETGNCAL